MQAFCLSVIRTNRRTLFFESPNLSTDWDLCRLSEIFPLRPAGRACPKLSSPRFTKPSYLPCSSSKSDQISYYEAFVVGSLLEKCSAYEFLLRRGHIGFGLRRLSRN